MACPRCIKPIHTSYGHSADRLRTILPRVIYVCGMQDYSITDDWMARIRHHVRAAMRDQSVSMLALARSAHAGYPIVYEIVSGERRDIALSTLCRLARAIGVTPRDLLAPCPRK